MRTVEADHHQESCWHLQQTRSAAGLAAEQLATHLKSFPLTAPRTCWALKPQPLQRQHPQQQCATMSDVNCDFKSAPQRQIDTCSKSPHHGHYHLGTKWNVVSTHSAPLLECSTNRSQPASAVLNQPFSIGLSSAQPCSIPCTAMLQLPMLAAHAAACISPPLPAALHLSPKVSSYLLLQLPFFPTHS